MTILDKKTLKTLTQLCRIECTEAEQEALLHDLEKILNYVAELQEVDVTNIPPCNHVLEGIVNVMREDVVGETMPRDVFLANAPSHIGGLIRVPPVFKQK